MLEKSGWDKLIERTPLAVVVTGVLVSVIGAAGGQYVKSCVKCQESLSGLQE
jgi:hypothetical protein